MGCSFRKAYDTVDRDFLLAVLRRLGSSPHLLRWISLLLNDTYACTLVMGRLSRLLRFSSGTRQGCPLAPTLYLFVGQTLLRFLHKQGLGIDLPCPPHLQPLLDPGTTPGPHAIPAATLALAGGTATAPHPHPGSAPTITPTHPHSWKLTAVQYADDFKAYLPSPSAVQGVRGHKRFILSY